MSGSEWSPGTFVECLAPRAREALLSLGVRRRFDDGRRLMREGEPDTHVEVLIRGFVKITALVGGVEALMAIRVPGDVLGETASLTGQPRMATVVTCGRVACCAISGADFRRFIRQYPEASASLARTTGDRLRWANSHRADFTAYPAEVRLARILLDLASRCGRPTEVGIVIGPSLSQPELASMIGIAEATFQKAIRELRDGGLISTGYRRIAVTDVDGLRALGQSSS